MNKQQQTQADELLKSTLFDFSAPPPPDQCFFYMHWKRILNLGDYMLFTGKKGTGKTKIVSAAIAAAYTRVPVFNLTIKLPDGKRRIIHLDTEQSRTSHWRMMEMIKKLGNINELSQDYFRTHRLRGYRPHVIQLMIERYLQITPDCGLIILDGMLDVVDNMNDVIEAKRLKEWMERISEQYNVGIAGVMHRGFTADKSIGHSGSYLERGAQTVLKIEKDKRENTEFYVISTEHIREDAAPPDTAFFYNKATNDWELFEMETATMPLQDLSRRKNNNNSPLQYDIQEHGRRCGQIFDCRVELLSYDQLIREIQQAYGCSQGEAKKEFYQYLINNLFWKTEAGYTNKRQARLFIQN